MIGDTLKRVTILAVRKTSSPFKTKAGVNSYMSTSVGNGSRRESDTHRHFPAYGPIDAVLGFVLFYVLIDRATPKIVTVFSETVLDLSSSFVRFGLAVVLWFMLVVVVINQTRRQLAALGVLTYDDYQLRVWSRVTPASVRTSGYLFAFVAGTVLAAMTFDRALEVLLSLIPTVATVDVGAFNVVALLEMIVFFIAYRIATHSLDRLVIDGIRALARS